MSSVYVFKIKYRKYFKWMNYETQWMKSPIKLHEIRERMWLSLYCELGTKCYIILPHTKPVVTGANVKVPLHKISSKESAVLVFEFGGASEANEFFETDPTAPDRRRALQITRECPEHHGQPGPSIAALKLAHPGPASITVILNSDLRLKLAPYQLPHELLARIRVCVPVTLAQIAAIAYILASDASARQSAGNPVYLNIILSARQYSMANIGGGSSAGGNEALSTVFCSTPYSTSRYGKFSHQIVVIGDEIAYGVGDTSRLGAPPGLAKHLCQKLMNEAKVKHIWEIYNQGKSRSTSRDWLPRSERKDGSDSKGYFESVFSNKKTEQAEVVIIMLGFNDASKEVFTGARLDAQSYEFRSKEFYKDGVYLNQKAYKKLAKDFGDMILNTLVKREFDVMKSILGL
ncbi:hypothetical protein HDU79_000512 [Rhizoclosmatium sp. JEL0117]|nr:hypothetical protein HDU79_000512 [Rhizoclosmatium sp. JEL0117]